MIVVLGHSPHYRRLAEEIGGIAFSVPDAVWAAMSREEQWALNRQFLDTAIALQAVFVLATSPVDALTNSPSAASGERWFYALELDYMRQKGYDAVLDGEYWTLVK